MRSETFNLPMEYVADKIYELLKRRGFRVTRSSYSPDEEYIGWRDREGIFHTCYFGFTIKRGYFCTFVSYNHCGCGHCSYPQMVHEIFQYLRLREREVGSR